MSSREGRRALVIGATGVPGPWLLDQLDAAGFTVHAVSRSPPSGGAGAVAWEQADVSSGWTGPATPGDAPPVLVHAAPLWLLPPLVASLAGRGVRRLVAVGSASRDSKATSGDPIERETARRLQEAEDAVKAASGSVGVEWTLLRPTLVWGGGRDRNVSDIARFVRRFGFFPVAGPGHGLRQPLHAADLAGACVGVIDRPTSLGRLYDLGGGRTLTYTELVADVARGLGHTPRLVHLPVPLARAVLRMARRLPGYGHLTPEVADRMNVDLVCDPSAARRDFGFAPRPFRFPEEPGPC